MKIDRQQIILTVNKYVSYLINIIIVSALLAGVGAFVYGLYIAIQ